MPEPEYVNRVVSDFVPHFIVTDQNAAHLARRELEQLLAAAGIAQQSVGGLHQSPHGLDGRGLVHGQ